MSKEMEYDQVPSLRFSKFKKGGSWKETTVENEILYENGKAHENNISESGKFIVVNSKFISSDGKVQKFTNNGFCIADKGDILMVLSDVPNGKAIAKCFYVDKDNTYTVNQRICRLKPKKASGLLLYYILNRNSYFLSFDDGVKQTNLKNSDVLNCPIILPKDSEEQQNIADCLSSLDELITAEIQKLDVLKLHKKGLMQQLFPAEGETVPKLRFAEFQNSMEWEEKTLGSAARFINGRAYKQEELLDKGKYRVLRVGNFFTNNEWYYSDLELEADKYCVDGDLLYAWSASFGPRIWKGEKTIYHYHIWKVINHKGIHQKFLFILLDNETIKMKSKSANGFALLHITKNTIENWKCSFPNEEEEQLKIANCLSSLDELIKAQVNKIEGLKEHKKGLMQKLFPKVLNYD
jgi:type I restriction enzyme, S subunit